MILEETSMDVLEATALNEYTEVGFFDRLFLRSNDVKYYEWIKQCESKSELKTFIHHMKIVINPKSTKRTRVDTMIIIVKFLISVGISFGFSAVFKRAIGGSTSFTQSFLIGLGAGFAGDLAIDTALNKLQEDVFTRFKPMVTAAEARLAELQARDGKG